MCKYTPTHTHTRLHTHRMPSRVHTFLTHKWILSHPSACIRLIGVWWRGPMKKQWSRQQRISPSQHNWSRRKATDKISARASKSPTDAPFLSSPFLLALAKMNMKRPNWGPFPGGVGWSSCIICSVHHAARAAVFPFLPEPRASSPAPLFSFSFLCPQGTLSLEKVDGRTWRTRGTEGEVPVLVSSLTLRARLDLAFNTLGIDLIKTRRKKKINAFAVVHYHFRVPKISLDGLAPWTGNSPTSYWSESPRSYDVTHKCFLPPLSYPKEKKSAKIKLIKPQWHINEKKKKKTGLLPLQLRRQP